MRADEKYNLMIAEIEKSIREKPEITSAQIIQKLINEHGFVSRDREFKGVFEFINGNKPKQYISYRKMIYACEAESAKASEQQSVQNMMDICNMAEQSSFIRAFKRQFDSSPGVFLKSHRNYKGEEPAYWGTLNKETEEAVNNMNTETVNNENTTVFGLDMDTYHRIVRFQNLAASYGCSNIGAEAGYRFSEKYGKSLEESFEYAAQFEETEENIRELYNDELTYDKTPYGPDDFEKYHVDYLLEDMEDETVMYCHFDLGFDVDAALDVKYAMASINVNLSELDKPHAFALSYTSGATTPYEAWRLTDFYLSRSDDQEVNYEMLSEFLDNAPDRPEAGWDFTYDMSTIDWDDEDLMTVDNEASEKEWALIGSLLRDEERRAGWEYFKDSRREYADESDEEESEEDWDEEHVEEDDDSLIDHYLDNYDGDTYEDEFDADDLTIYEY